MAAIVFVFRRLLNRPFAPLLLAAAATALALFATAIDPGRARADQPHPRWGPLASGTASGAQPAAADDPIQMAVDMDPSSPPTVDSAATITVPEPFKVGINVTSVAPGTLYRGYQVEVQFPNDALEFVSATPAPSSPLQLCQAANDVFSADNSVEFVQDGCAKSSAGGVDYVEEVELMTFKCTSDGTFTIHMTTLTEDTAFGTAALDQNSAFIPTGTADGTVTCLGVAPPPACPAAPDFSFSVDDPTGDAFFGFGSGPGLHDITSVSGEGDAATLCLTVNFAGSVAPADARSADSVLGYIEFDTDANSGTGFSSAVDALCPSPSGMGVDAALDMFSASGGSATMFPSGTAVPVTFDQTSFTAVIPLAEIGGDNSFNFAMVLGTFVEPTDCAPNGGSIHSPDGSIVPFVPLTIIPSIDPVDSVVSSTGAVTISGTVTCSKPATARMAGSVRQRAGRAIITGRFFIDRFACDGETPWVADVVGENGIFKGGAADVSVEALGVTNIEFVFADASATVRLNGSRHLRGAMVPGLGDPTGLGGSGVLASLVIVGIVLGFVRRRRSGGRREP